MGSAGNVKKQVCEKETPVRRGQNPRFFLAKEKCKIGETSQETIYNYAKAKFNAVYHI